MDWTAVDSSRQHVGVLGLPLAVSETLYNGSADVHKYFEPALGRYVVGKRILALDRPMVDVLREARLQQRLAHDHLVPVITVSDIVDTSVDPPARLEDEVEIITPFYPRGSVFDALDRGERFDVCEALDIARAAALGLSELHREGYVHRDFKSPNLFLTDDGSVARVGDLGEAHPLDAAGTAPGIDSPTPWIAPEQIAAGKATVASDLFGLGVTLLEMLIGGLDLDGYSRVKARHRMVQGHPPLPRSQLAPPPWAPPAVRTLVRQLTERNPSRRAPTSAEAVADRLATTPAVGWRQVDAGTHDRWEGRARGDGLRYAVDARRLPRAGRWDVAVLRSGKSGWRSFSRMRVGDDGYAAALQDAFDQAVASAH